MRKILIAAGVVSMVSLSMAQTLEVGVDGGYGFGVGTALVGRNNEFDDVTWNRFKYEQVYASGGKGVKIMGEAAYFLTENVGIMVASGYSMKSSYTTLDKDPSRSITMKGTTSYLPVNVGLKFRAKMGIMGIHVLPYVYVAPGIYLPKKTETVDTTTSMSTTELTYTYEMGFGVSSGVGAEIILPFFSDRVGIKVEFAPTYAFANPAKFDEKKTDKTDASITTTTTYTYKNNTTPEDQLPGDVLDQPHDSFCSMTVRAGLCFKIF
jgi:hypothetical protein